jgi:multiple sugar transport system permease protein
VLRNTTVYVVGTVPAGIVLSLLLALAMNAPIRGIAIYRALFFIPVISSSVAVAVMWQWLFNTDFGLINYGLSFFGVHPIPWLTSTGWAMPAVIIMAIWKHLGYDMIIYLAGLQGIPSTLYEAASIDGANARQALRWITVPLMRPVILFVVIITTIMVLNMFEAPYIMTKGGPEYSSQPLMLTLYQTAFQFGRFGAGSALAIVISLITIAITLVQVRLINRPGGG